MLEATKYIIELFENDEFRPLLVQGGHGYGKTSYSNRILAEIGSINNNGKPNWNIKYFEKHLGYTPDEVLHEWNLIPEGIKDYAYHWDDAGNWLHSLDFQDPFVKAVGKYMQVARTDWASLIFSTIDVNDVSSKIRGIKNAIIVDITKEGKNVKQPNRRTARAYIIRKTWRGREWKEYVWEDMFDSHVPGNYNPLKPERIVNPNIIQKNDNNITWGFYGWYKPKRDYYAKVAKKKAEIYWKRKKKKDKI
jgi:hypothetical protein